MLPSNKNSFCSTMGVCPECSKHTQPHHFPPNPAQPGQPLWSPPARAREATAPPRLLPLQRQPQNKTKGDRQQPQPFIEGHSRQGGFLPPAPCSPSPPPGEGAVGGGSRRQRCLRILRHLGGLRVPGPVQRDSPKPPGAKRPLMQLPRCATLPGGQLLQHASGRARGRTEVSSCQSVSPYGWNRARLP